MTKPRDPLSIEAAMLLCLRTLGHAEAASLCGKSESYLRQCSDPENARELSTGISLRLDGAMRALGRGQPIYDAYGALLEGSPSARAGQCLLTALASVSAQLGPLARTVSAALEDGTIDLRESREIAEEGYALIAQIRALIDSLPQRSPIAAD